MGMNAAIINQETAENNSQTNTALELSDDNNSIQDADIGKELDAEDDLTVETDEEPEKTGEEVTDNQDSEDDGEEIEIPEKFKNKDGSLNLKELAKAYKNLEPLRNQKADWLKEKQDLEQKAQLAEQYQKQQDDLAKFYGFENFDALQNHQSQLQVNTQMAQFEANSYASYLSLCENPQDVRDLLIRYAQNPSKELKQAIWDEFSDEVKEKVAEDVANFKIQQATQNQQNERAVNAKKAEEHITNVVNEYADWFQNKEFASVYALAFQYLGTDLDPQKMFPAMQALKESWVKEHTASQTAKSENDEATKALEALSPNSAKKQPKSNYKIDLDKTSPEDIDKLVGELV